MFESFLLIPELFLMIRWLGFVLEAFFMFDLVEFLDDFA